MMFKASAPKTSLLAEGTYPATLKSIKGLPDEVKPRKVEFGFKPDDHEGIVTKELPMSFDEGKPLRKDVETLLGHELKPSEAVTGFAPDKLINARCRIVVMHKSGSGGKPQAAVSLILPATETT